MTKFQDLVLKSCGKIIRPISWCAGKGESVGRPTPEMLREYSRRGQKATFIAHDEMAESPHVDHAEILLRQTRAALRPGEETFRLMIPPEKRLK